MTAIALGILFHASLGMLVTAAMIVGAACFW